ncbi:MAG: inositol monophosphatase [Actinomycetota bacterium]|nr:inositol monophosphatase [Actinomycetota bacterium]
MADSRSLDRLLDAARAAAVAGGEVVRRAGADGADGAGAEATQATIKNGPGDYVTEVDRHSERVVVEALVAAAPGIPVVGEEEGGHGGDRYWVVDPLDGTTNFLHRFPLVGVSVALVEQGRPVVGVVHAPFLEETYSAARGEGATVVEHRRSRAARPLRVSLRDPSQAVVATGFPFRHKDLVPRYGRMLLRSLERFEDLRRPGAASLDLAWVAAGVFDGFFELRLSAWDVAAGGLLIEEAGGVVTDWEGGPDYLSGDILAGPSQVQEVLLDLARKTE